MKFRDVAGGRIIASPSLDDDELERSPCSFQGEFDLDRLHVRGGDSFGSRGQGSITHSIVSDIDLTGATLCPLVVSDARLKGVDLSNSTIREAALRRVEWLHGRAIGLCLSVDRLEDIYAEGVRFDYATVHIERVKGMVIFHGCSFREAEIGGDLSDIVFDECELNGVQFSARTARGADLKTSRLDGAHGLLSLRGAKITAEQALSIADQLAVEAGISVEN
ncbi:MAG: pentapeptide repeat-containing protein [Gammaproteobacteria bacterium]